MSDISPYKPPPTLAFTSGTRYVVWIPDDDTVGVLAGHVVETEFGQRVEPNSLIILASETAYVKWLLHERPTFLSVRQYASRFGVPHRLVARYAASNLGRALGVRDAKLPEDVGPDVWRPLLLSRHRPEELRMQEIKAFLLRFGTQRLEHLTFHFSTHVSQAAVRATVGKMVAVGELIKTGRGRGAAIRVAEKLVLDRLPKP